MPKARFVRWQLSSTPRPDRCSLAPSSRTLEEEIEFQTSDDGYFFSFNDTDNLLWIELLDEYGNVLIRRKLQLLLP